MDFFVEQLPRGTSLAYTGLELNHHWIYRKLGRLGSGMVCFEGPAQVNVTEMVDLTDVQKRAFIFSPHMLHFLCEWFSVPLLPMVLAQNNFIFLVAEYLAKKGIRVARTGNDLYVNDRKLSVSIATQTVVSSLFHIGINVQSDGAPVPAIGLSELHLDSYDVGSALCAAFQIEWAHWHRSVVKVSPR